MTTPSSPPDRDRGRWRDLWFGVIGVIAVLGGIMLSDLAFEEGEPVFPEGGEAVEVRIPDSDDPGGVLIPVDIPVAGPLFEDAAEVIPTAADGNGGRGATPGGGTQGGSAGGGSESAGNGTPSEGTDRTRVVGRWLDICADQAGQACPIGVGAWIDDVVPLEITVLPDATAASLPGLRCDPGYRTETTVPIVILMSRPAFVEVELLTGGGSAGFLGSLTFSSEVSAWEERRKESPSVMGANLESGVHLCVPIELGTPLAQVQNPDRNGPFVARVTARSEQPPQSVTEEVPFTGQYNDERPPIWLVPRSETQAYLSVPQKSGENTEVWVYETGLQNLPFGPEGCEAGEPQLPGSVAPQSADPIPMAPGFLDPNHEQLGYGEFTVWDLRLLPGQEYTLCVNWPVEGAIEEWQLLTPDGHRLDIVAGALWIGDPPAGAKQGSLRVPIQGAPGCSKGEFLRGSLPHEDVIGPGSYDDAAGDVICTSFGPFDDFVQVGIGFSNESEREDYVSMPFALQQGLCTEPLDLSDPVDGAPFRGSALSWLGGVCETRVEIQTPCVIGRGPTFIHPYVDLFPHPPLARPIVSTSECHTLYRLGLGFEIEIRDANHRPDPLDWGVELVERGTS